jgi:phosphonate transport system ATP-binding protein
MVAASVEETLTSTALVLPDFLSANGTRRAPALIARDLWLSYDRQSYVLQGVGLAVERGAMTMILGRSGSGKTTLLKVLNGLLRPQRGSVELVCAAGANGRRPQQHIAYVPQTLGLVRNMSALENALTGALSYTPALLSLARVFPKGTVAEAKRTLADLGLGDKLNEQVYALSGGERQRVAIARALMQHPDVILADEFVSQLDPVTTEDILEQMRAIARRGVGLLITTHETEIVASHADRLVVMRDGRIAYDGGVAGIPVAGMKGLLR